MPAVIVLIVIFTWAGYLPAQVSLRAKQQVKLDLAEHHHHGALNILLLSSQENALYYLDRTGKIHSFDRNGYQTDRVTLNCFKAEKKGEFAFDPCYDFIRAFPSSNGYSICNFQGISWCSSKGSALHTARLENPQNLRYALHLKNHYAHLYFTIEINSLEQVIHAKSGIWYVPISSKYWESEKNNYQKDENPVHIFSDYRRSRYETNAPLGVSFIADTTGHQPPVIGKNGKVKYEPIVATDYRFFGRLDTLAINQYHRGRFNAGAALGFFIARDPANHKLYCTTGTNSIIQVYDSNMTEIGQIKKQGYSPELFAWFTLEEVRALPREGKHGDEIVSQLAAAVYGESPIESQLFADSSKRLLYRIVSQPQQGQNRQFWLKTYENGVQSYIAIDSMRSRTLQVYDLGDGGRFLNEIPVPPLFRILEIDANGDLWAVSGVDGASVTITRYRVVRED